jgi:hypothetical protein
MSNQTVNFNNVKKVKAERGGICFYTSDDKQLYKRKFASGNTVYFECCRNDCLGAVKLSNNVIQFHKPHSVSHANQEQEFLILLFRQTLSEEAVKHPSKQQHLMFDDVRRRPE